ncbi:MAG TPA: peptidase S8 [Lachnospiraceae bacterium]|nr:peptidase S8 [Lachnospiraceae bacterium]
MNTLTGKNIDIVSLDSGIEGHPDFEGRIASFIDFVNGRETLYDDFGHGTHVAGIIAGSGRMSGGVCRGYAPAARLHVLKILDNKGNGSRDAIHRALGWIRENQASKSLRILNFSVGTVENDRTLHREILDAVEGMVEMGLIVVAAAGNLGPRAGTVTAPGSSRKVLTVGASDMLQHSFAYSGRGPTMDCVCKPEVIFPGKRVRACAASVENKGWYCEKSGTSMSSAAVAGILACYLEKYPNATNRDIKLRIRECTRDLGYPMNVQGWGELDVKKFLGDTKSKAGPLRQSL